MSANKLSPGIKRLRRVVITMGIVLVVATLALFIAAFIKFSHIKPHEDDNRFADNQTLSEKCDYKPKDAIVVGGDVIGSTVNGSVLTIITAKQKSPLEISKNLQGSSLTLTAKPQQYSQEIVIYDLCKGKVLSQITVLN
jgi:hypothetical protein